MILQAFSFLLLAAGGASASHEAAIDLSTGDIAANSDLGRALLSKARSLGNNNNNNYDYSWVSNYSIKFQQCTATHNYYGGYFGGNNNQNKNNGNRNNYNGMYEQRLVHFKLCPSSSCDSCEGGADYVVDMNEFVNAYVESKLSAQEYNCERARENCYCQNGNDDQNNCEYYCYQNAGLDYCYQYQNNNNNGNNNNKNQFNLQEALECRKLEVNDDALQYYYYNQGNNYNNYNQYNRDGKMEFFVGPYCANHGKKILLGVFMDETCSFAAPDGIYEKLNYGQKLPYSGESLVQNNCVSCAEPQDYNQQNNKDQNDADAITDVCQRLYEPAGKCEAGMSISYPNTMACDFIKTLPKISHWNIQPAKAISAKVLAGVFASTTALAAGLAVYLHNKIQQRNASNLSTYGEMA